MDEGPFSSDYMGWPSARLFGWSAWDWSSPAHSNSLNSDTRNRVCCRTARGYKKQLSTNWLCEVWSLHWKGFTIGFDLQPGSLAAQPADRPPANSLNKVPFAPESTQTYIPHMRLIRSRPHIVIEKVFCRRKETRESYERKRQFKHSSSWAPIRDWVYLCSDKINCVMHFKSSSKKRSAKQSDWRLPRVNPKRDLPHQSRKGGHLLGHSMALVLL